MKKLKKINLKKNDYVILNDGAMSHLMGGERTPLYCKLGNKIWECLQLEISCPNSFNTGDCGKINFICSAEFEISPFKN